MKLLYPYSLENAKINRNSGEIFLSIKDSCSECKLKIHIYCQSEPTDDTILYVSIFDSRGVTYEKKRQVHGDRRIRIGKELQGTSTYAWRWSEANRLIEFGDVILRSRKMLHVKQNKKTRDKELGLFKVKAAFASVWDMKYGQEFNGCIYEIGLDKFYVMYWSSTQLFCITSFRRKTISVVLALMQRMDW